MTSFRANEKLLSALSRKSPQQFQLFLDALDNCGQRHVRNVISDRPPGLSLVLASSFYLRQVDQINWRWTPWYFGEDWTAFGFFVGVSGVTENVRLFWVFLYWDMEEIITSFKNDSDMDSKLYFISTWYYLQHHLP